MWRSHTIKGMMVGITVVVAVVVVVVVVDTTMVGEGDITMAEAVVVTIGTIHMGGKRPSLTGIVTIVVGMVIRLEHALGHASCVMTTPTMLLGALRILGCKVGVTVGMEEGVVIIGILPVPTWHNHPATSTMHSMMGMLLTMMMTLPPRLTWHVAWIVSFLPALVLGPTNPTVRH
jgi:hypothetical protein